MPMPAAPRRAGPPRRKVPAKSDSTKTEEEAQAIAPTSNAEGSEVQEVPKVIENAPDTEDKEETEEDEVARKKRVAEKMAQMGGVNPLAPRPEIPTPSASMQEVPLAAEPEGGYEAGEESGAEKATEEGELERQNTFCRQLTRLLCRSGDTSGAGGSFCTYWGH